MGPMHRSLLVALSLVGALVLIPVIGIQLTGAQQVYADPAFERTRDRLDRPVEEGQTSRTWFWGPEPISEGIYEPYAESPGGERLVQYIDKARFELTQPDGDPESAWYVSTGLLTRELISGSVQTGDARYEQHEPATQAMAGDASNTWPTYAGFDRVIDQLYADMTGEHATNVLLPIGVTSHPEAEDDPNAEIVEYITYDGPDGPAGYNVPAAFWNFMNASGPVWDGTEYVDAAPLMEWLYVMGFPISDPFWVTVDLNGEPTWVMVQAFERRVLTYTPSNPEGWQVEMGNVGRHYLEWRHGAVAPPAPEPTSTPDATPLPTSPIPTVPATPSPTPPPAGGEGRSTNFFAFQAGNTWTYQDRETGELTFVRIPGRSDQFIEGKSLWMRVEERPDGSSETSYWQTSNNILWLYGRETFDSDGELVQSIVYEPEIRYIIRSQGLGEGWASNSRPYINGIPMELIQYGFKIDLLRDLTVPAGTFSISHIVATETETDGDRLVGPTRVVQEIDFAPFYGMVRIEREDGTILELLAYSLR